jgi:hypothetical protein
MLTNMLEELTIFAYKRGMILWEQMWENVSVWRE